MKAIESIEDEKAALFIKQFGIDVKTMACEAMSNKLIVASVMEETFPTVIRNLMEYGKLVSMNNDIKQRA